MDTRTDPKTVKAISELLGVGPGNTLALQLAERRITPEVIATFQIQPCGDGWTYPTPYGALRFKNADSNAPNKYAWIGEERDTLFYAFDFREAIQMTGGHVWLTTEFDYFAMRSAGIFHVIAQMQGEGSVPDDLAPLLQSLGVLVCHIAPDRDDQGVAWAQLVAEKLTTAGIQVIAHELPFPQTKKSGGDIGKLWQGYTRLGPLEYYLFSLPASVVKPKIAVSQKPQKEYVIPNDIKDEIARALGVSRFNSKGYSEKLSCLFHNDRNPSAALHRDFGLHCFTCNRWYRWKDLAEKLGLIWRNTAPTGDQGIGLGDELIQAMIQRGADALAYTLETMYRAGWKPGQSFTVKSLIALGIPERRARKAIAQTEGHGYDLRKQNSRGRKGKRKENTYGELTPFFFTPKEELILNKKSRGQPEKVKRLPHPPDLARALGLTVTRYSPVTMKQNLADWRAEIYALPIDRDPGSYPRKELCQPLGISTTTAQAYDKRAQLTVTPKTDRKAIESADSLPDTPELKATWLETADAWHFAATKAGYERAAKHANGGKVYKVKQLANEYRRTTP
jgi:hypothetical protein